MNKLLVGAGAALLCSCSSGEVALKIQVAGTASQALTATDVAAASVLPDGLSVDKARLLLNEVEMHGQGGMGDGRAVRGPYVLTLSGSDLVSAATKTVADVTVPSGTYRDLELEFEPLDTSEQTETTPSSATAADLADFTAVGASAIVEGSYNGTSFKIVGKLSADHVTNTPVQVASGIPVDIAVTIDPRTWFRDDAGAVIDPTVAANNDLIAQRLCLSLDPGTGGQGSACLGQKDHRGGDHHGKGGPGR